MSNRSDSSKKSKSEKKRISQKVKNFTTKQNIKVTKFSSKVKRQFSAFYSEKIVHQEVYVDGKVPKSYSGKFFGKFIGLYLIFIIYSLFLIIGINFPGSKWINIVTFGNPFSFSNALVAFFLVLSLLLSIDKIRIFFFEKKTAIKQIILYCGLISLLYYYL